jgi:hypothetical protein
MIGGKELKEREATVTGSGAVYLIPVRTEYISQLQERDTIPMTKSG